MKRSLLLLSVAVALSACAKSEVTTHQILQHRDDYLNATNGRDLVVPPPLSDYLITREFNVPTIHGQIGGEPIPPDSDLMKQKHSLHS